MQFFFTKLVSFFISPENWIIACTVLYLLIRNKRWKNIFGLCSLAAGLLFTNPLLFRRSCLAWQPEKPNEAGKYTAAILPGGIASYDRYNNGYFNESSDRFIQTAALYHQGIVSKIIVTGGNGFLDRNLPPESAFLRSSLLQQGVRPEHILVESQSRNTEQNAQFTRRLIDSLGLQPPFILVTSAMHMRRCAQEFRNAGITVIQHPGNYEVIPSRQPWYDQLWPDLSLPEKWGRLFKEMLGFMVSKRRQAASSETRSGRITPAQKATHAS